MAPVIAVLVAAERTWAALPDQRGLTRGPQPRLRIGDRSARPPMVSLRHGTNDAQRNDGVIRWPLIANGTLPANGGRAFWVI